jgi:predicted N-acetyltransferase YhbS
MSKLEFTLRPATAADAPFIAQLSTTLGYSAEAPVVARRLRAIVASETDLMIVAVGPDSTVIGWLQAHAAHIVESGFRVEITGLIVAPQQRLRGVGRELIRQAEQWAISISAEAVVVRSNVQRSESHAFYHALGYNLTKTQSVYRKKLAG